MEVRDPSTSDGPQHASSSSPTPTPTTTPLAEQIQLQRFNETQMLTGTNSTRSVGIGGDTNVPGREPVRLRETEDEEDEMDDGERGRVLGVFEVDVSNLEIDFALSTMLQYFSLFPSDLLCCIVLRTFH
jgi:hypothetical protein